MTLNEENEPVSVAVVHGAYVNKEFRRLGIGKLLLNFLINKVKNINNVKTIIRQINKNQHTINSHSIIQKVIMKFHYEKVQ